MIVVEMYGYIDIDFNMQFSKCFNHMKSTVQNNDPFETHLEFCHSGHLTLETSNANVRTLEDDIHCKPSMVPSSLILLMIVLCGNNPYSHWQTEN